MINLDNQKELILASFKKGLSIAGITTIVHNSKQNKEKEKKSSNRDYAKIKFSVMETKHEVESTIYEDYMKMLKGQVKTDEANDI